MREREGKEIGDLGGFFGIGGILAFCAAGWSAAVIDAPLQVEARIDGKNHDPGLLLGW
jgi:hypothetical protein